MAAEHCSVLLPKGHRCNRTATAVDVQGHPLCAAHAQMQPRRRASSSTGAVVPVSPEPPRRAPTLSSQQRQVLQLVATGASTAEVAACLGISPHTVQIQLHSIFTKLGARSRLEAVILALHQGLISLPVPGRNALEDPAADDSGPPRET